METNVAVLISNKTGFRILIRCIFPISSLFLLTSSEYKSNYYSLSSDIVQGKEGSFFRVIFECLFRDANMNLNFLFMLIIQKPVSYFYNYGLCQKTCQYALFVVIVGCHDIKLLDYLFADLIWYYIFLRCSVFQ